MQKIRSCNLSAWSERVEREVDAFERFDAFLDASILLRAAEGVKRPALALRGSSCCSNKNNRIQMQWSG